MNTIHYFAPAHLPKLINQLALTGKLLQPCQNLIIHPLHSKEQINPC